MEDCQICFSELSNKTLPCCHKLCSKCVVRLNSASCPFCRQNFIFSSEEIKERLKLKIINGYDWEVPSNIAFRETNLNNRQLNTITEETINLPFSRVIQNMQRRRRRCLSFEEVLERRQLIRKKILNHWNRKHGYLQKTNQGCWEL